MKKRKYQAGAWPGRRKRREKWEKMNENNTKITENGALTIRPPTLHPQFD